MNRCIELRKTNPLLGITLLLAFGLMPLVKAVVPSPDGGYPNFTTAEGQNALFTLSSGAANTAVGWFSLKSVTTGSFNTGVRRRNLGAQHRRCQYGKWDCGALIQYHRLQRHGSWSGCSVTQYYCRRQYGRRSVCSFQQHHRRRQYGERFSSALEQYDGQRKHGRWSFCA